MLRNEGSISRLFSLSRLLTCCGLVQLDCDKEVLSGLDGLCVHCVSSPSLYLSVCSMISSIIVPRAPYENWNTFYGEPEALMVLVNVLMVCALIYTLNNMHIHWTSELLPTYFHILQRSVLTMLVYGQDSYIMHGYQGLLID